MPEILLSLLPELRDFPPSERRAALRRARDHELDVLELVGLAFAFVLAVLLTHHVLGGYAAPSRLAAFFTNLAVGLPVIFVAFLPFHLRRLRRGLRAQSRGGSAR